MTDLVKKYYAIITAVVVFIIYVITMAPSIVQIDSGELAAVQATLGIAHPTGYPLYTLLGYLFLYIPLPFTKIYQANLLAALYCSVGIAFFIASAKLVLENLSSFKKNETQTKKKKPEKKKESNKGNVLTGTNINTQVTLSVILGGIILAFSKTYWFQSTSVEVYSLHLFLINLIIFFLLKAFIQKENDTKYWLAFASVLALSFSNHMTTILIIPSTAYLYFAKHKFNKASFTKIGLMLLVFFPVLLLCYSYLPIRAAQNPVINWGNPVDLERILRHISGKQYQVWLFESTESARKQLSYFVNNLPSEFATIGMIFWLIGIFSTFILARRFFVFTLITFLSTILYSVNYNIHDIDSYFLLAYIALAFFAVFGISRLFDILTAKKEPVAIPLSAISVIIILQFYLNFGKVNQSNVYIFDDYCKSLLNSVEKTSIIFSYQWDFFISGSYYFQKVEGFRKDVAVIDKELLRRSWYYNQLNRNYPGIARKIQPEINAFISAVQPFERDENYDAAILENSYRNVMSKLITENINTHSYYIGPELFENEIQKGQFEIPKGYYLVPDLFLFKVVQTTDYVPAADPNFKIRIPEERNYYYNFIENNVCSMLVRRALYEMKFDKIERARIYINKVKKDFPAYHLPDELVNVFK